MHGKKKALMELSVLSLHPPCEYLTSLIAALENTELAVFQLSCSSYCQREVLHSHKLSGTFSALPDLLQNVCYPHKSVMK